MTGLVHMQVIVNLFTSKDKEINKSVVELIVIESNILSSWYVTGCNRPIKLQN